MLGESCLGWGEGCLFDRRRWESESIRMCMMIECQIPFLFRRKCNVLLFSPSPPSLPPLPLLLLTFAQHPQCRESHGMRELDLVLLLFSSLSSPSSSRFEGHTL